MVKSKYWFLTVNGQLIGKYETLGSLYDAITDHVTIDDDQISIEGRYVEEKD